jgi:acyl-CoA synthetase (AMP-forming)/AMP-acid ligase II
VAYVLPNCTETVVALLGGAIAGIVNPINPLLEPAQIAAILREIEQRLVLVEILGVEVRRPPWAGSLHPDRLDTETVPHKSPAIPPLGSPAGWTGLDRDLNSRAHHPFDLFERCARGPALP